MEGSVAGEDALLEMIREKRYGEVLEAVAARDKDEVLLKTLLSAYGGDQNHNEDDLQNWLEILASATTQNTCSLHFLGAYSSIVEQFIARTSPKYALIIIKSILHRLNTQFSCFVLASNVHHFYSLIADPTFDDLAHTISQLQKSFQEIQQEISQQSKQNTGVSIEAVFHSTLKTFLNNILAHPIKINSNFTHKAIQQCISLLKTIFQLSKDQQSDSSLAEMPLKLLAKFNLTILQVKASILFTQSFLSQYADTQFTSFVYSKEWITRLLIRTVNSQLKVDLSAPPRISAQEEQFLHKSLNHLCSIFANKDSQQTYHFLTSNFAELQQFIEKIQIYLGSINPQDPLAKQIHKVFVVLPFLGLQAKERLYSKLLSKHSNYSFKVHCITQIRQLLNPACTRTVWIRITPLLINQLKQLQPSTSIDYVGHIISVAFFWKELFKRLSQNPVFAKTLHLNIGEISAQFQKGLKKLKEGLQVKVQMHESQNSQLQRNQTNLCIFRISEMLAKL